MTLLSRVFGYIRDLLQAAILGAADSADAYVIALRIPNLLRRLLGEGAMTAAFVPVFMETRKTDGDEDTWRFTATAFWTLGAVLLIITGIGILAAPGLVRFLAYGFTGIEGKIPLTVLLTRITFSYLLFIGLAALVMATLNSLGRFAVPAFTPVLLNLSIITCALLFARTSEQPSVWFAIGVLIGGALQLLFQLPVLLRHCPLWPPRISFRDPRIRRVGALMLPGLFGVGVTQLNLVVDSQVASFLGTGSVSYLYYAVRVEELVLGVFVISLSTVILPTLSRNVADGRDDLMRHALGRALRMVIFVTVPAMAGLWVLRVPIIQTLFERGSFTRGDTLFTSTALGLYGCGLLGNGVVKILAPAFYARFDTRTPVKVGAVAFALHVPLCIGLATVMGHGGIALSTTLASSFNALALFALLARREGRAWLGGTGLTLIRAAAAAALMGGTLWAVVNWLGFDAVGALRQGVTLALLVGSGALVYLLASLLLGHRSHAESGAASGAGLRAVVQRVSEASVAVDGRRVAAIGCGALVLLGIVKGDTDKDADWLAGKISGLRFFADEEQNMNLGLSDIDGEMLVVSQFTLAASVGRGRRPGFDRAAPPDLARPLYDRFVAAIASGPIPVRTGLFGAMMEVALVNDGPVTFVIDSPAHG